jgi:hypothetical protein
MALAVAFPADLSSHILPFAPAFASAPASERGSYTLCRFRSVHISPLLVSVNQIIKHFRRLRTTNKCGMN